MIKKFIEKEINILFAEKSIELLQQILVGYAYEKKIEKNKECYKFWIRHKEAKEFRLLYEIKLNESLFCYNIITQSRELVIENFKFIIEMQKKEILSRL